MEKALKYIVSFAETMLPYHSSEVNLHLYIILGMPFQSVHVMK